MTLYAERLVRRTQLLAELVEQLVHDRARTYQQLSSQSGVSRNVLMHFASSRTKQKDSAETPSIKVGNLHKLLEWFELTDFDGDTFNDDHRRLAGEIRQTFQHEDSNKIFGDFTRGFRLEPSEKALISKHFNGTFLGVRRRGKSKKLQVSAIRFSTNFDSPHIEWQMIFKQHTKEVPESGADPAGPQRMRIVEGYLGNNEISNSCLGRRRRSNELYFINIIANIDHKPLDRYNALLSTYSYREAISRAMVLIRRRDLDSIEEMELFDWIGDFLFEDIEESTGIKGIDELQISHRVSALEKGFKGPKIEETFDTSEIIKFLEKSQ